MKTTTKSLVISALSDGQPWTMAALVHVTKSNKQSVSKRIYDLREECYDINSVKEWRNGKLFRSTYQLTNINKRTTLNKTEQGMEVVK